MMLALLAHRLPHSPRRCGIGKYLSSIKPRTTGARARYPKIQSTGDEEGWHPFRVTFDYSYIKALGEGRIDHYHCYQKGDIVADNDDKPYLCSEADVLTPSRIQATIDSFEWIKRYLNALLQVPTRTTEPIDLLNEDGNDLYPISQNSFKDSDLYITVYARPLDSSILAFAFPINYWGFSTEDQNPDYYIGVVQGAIVLNPQEVSDHIQTVDSSDRYVFGTYLHEIMHVLGFASFHFPFWRDPDTLRSYKDPVAQTITFAGRSAPSLIVNTPTLHEVIVQRNGVEYFSDVNGTTIKSGAEFEDFGGPSSAGAHFEMRTINFELMDAIGLDTFYISNLTLALLRDTGWYRVNFSMAEEYPYGDSKYAGTQLEAFLSEAPQLSFPPHYLPTEAGLTNGCSFDFHYGGYFNASECTTPDCLGYFPFEISGKKYSDPIWSSSDFLPLLNWYSDRYCTLDWNGRNPPKSEIDKFGFHFGWNSYCTTSTGPDHGPGCYEMECNGNDLFVILRGKKFQCKKGMKFSVTDTVEMNCPDPELICKIIKMDMDRKQRQPKIVDSVAAPDNSFWVRMTEKGISKGVFGVIIVICIVVLCAIIGLTLWCVLKKKSSDIDDDDDDEELENGVLPA